MPRVPTPLAQVALAALNHVLTQQPSLRDGLRAHAGRDVRIIVAGPFGAGPLGSVHTDARISPEGHLQAIPRGEPAATLKLTVSVDAVFDGLRGGSEALAPHLAVEGDLMVAAALADVARSVRWDFEEDLSKVTGDVIAHRIGRAVRGFGAALRGFDERSSDAVSRKLTTAGGPLVGRREFGHFQDALQSLAGRISRLEQGQGRH